MPRRSRAAIQAAEQEELLRQALAGRLAQGALRQAPKSVVPEKPLDLSQAIAGFANQSLTTATTYETIVYRDGSTSCNCPAWTNKKKDKPRSCRHVREIAPHVADIVSGAAKAEKYGGVTAGARKLMPAVQIRGDGMTAMDPDVLPTKRVRRDED